MFSLWMDARAGFLSLLGRKPRELNGQGNGSSHGQGDEIELTSQSRSMHDS
jgi:hypothetical protein